MILEVCFHLPRSQAGPRAWLDFYEKNGVSPPSPKHLGGLVGFFVSEMGLLQSDRSHVAL